jgi:hypothetical protein
MLKGGARMRTWLKRTVILIAVLNLMMLGAAAIPVQATDGGGAGQGASIADGTDSNDVEGVPDSCRKCSKCHGFWKCLFWCGKCFFDIID